MNISLISLIARIGLTATPSFFQANLILIQQTTCTGPRKGVVHTYETDEWDTVFRRYPSPKNGQLLCCS